MTKIIDIKLMINMYIFIIIHWKFINLLPLALINYLKIRNQPSPKRKITIILHYWEILSHVDYFEHVCSFSSPPIGRKIDGSL